MPAAELDGTPGDRHTSDALTEETSDGLDAFLLRIDLDTEQFCQVIDVVARADPISVRELLDFRRRCVVLVGDLSDDLLEHIVEHKDATTEQLAITEFNSGIYVFELAHLSKALAKLTTNNAQGEEYLTDVLAILRNDGHRVSASVVGNADEVMGVNDRAQLALAGARMRDRINHHWLTSGVTIIDPTTTWIEPTVAIARDVVIEPNTHLKGSTDIAEGAHIGPDTTLIDCTVDEHATVLRTHATGSTIGPKANVGPLTFLRPGTVLSEHSKAGAYVEIKNAFVGKGSKVPHLSYVGDAEIGEDSNIGAATVFVNYDGVEKHRTVIGDSVRIGSDTMLVAPVTVGDGAYTAAGSVITGDIPAGSLAVGRATMRIIEKWVLRKRAGTSSAEKAQRALDQEDGK